MRTVYEISHKDQSGNTWLTLEERPESLQAAFAVAGHPDETQWFLWDDPRWRLTEQARLSTGQDVIIAPESIPETDAERIELAAKMLLDNGSFDGDHHKMWTIDQALRLLLGDRYEATIAEWCSGEDGPDTYRWDTGIAP
ncbi:hypothetical protein [Micromonospora sp. NPDC005652]|uniref:hypothetical protein n=1 Tax=Micromonospora sp. NPDC005652 TaxID=3157046 RepID=UPI0033C159A3